MNTKLHIIFWVILIKGFSKIEKAELISEGPILAPDMYVIS